MSPQMQTKFHVAFHVYGGNAKALYYCLTEKNSSSALGFFPIYFASHFLASCLGVVSQKSVRTTHLLLRTRDLMAVPIFSELCVLVGSIWLDLEGRHQTLAPGANSGFWSGGPSAVFDTRGLCEPKIAGF